MQAADSGRHDCILICILIDRAATLKAAGRDFYGKLAVICMAVPDWQVAVMCMGEWRRCLWQPEWQNKRTSSSVSSGLGGSGFFFPFLPFFPFGILCAVICMGSPLCAQYRNLEMCMETGHSGSAVIGKGGWQ